MSKYKNCETSSPRRWAEPGFKEALTIASLRQAQGPYLLGASFNPVPWEFHPSPGSEMVSNYKENSKELMLIFGAT